MKGFSQLGYVQQVEVKKVKLFEVKKIRCNEVN